MGLLSAAGKGADERDARPQGSYGFGRGIEGGNPSASQAEAGVISARLGRLVCWLAQSRAELAGDLKGEVPVWRWEPSESSYTQKLWMRVMREAAYLPG
jgi:hypothetical protein